MATAPAHVAPPPTLHLLLSFMLASSWAWLALLLATIAATLHALRLRFYSPRLPAHAQNASVLTMSPIDQPCKGQTSYPHAPLLQRHFKQRTGSKSTSALTKVVVYSRARLWCRVFSSAPFALHRTASESKLFQSHLECAQKHQRRLQQTAHVASKASAGPEGLPSTEQVLDLWKAEAQAARMQLKPESKTVPDKYGDANWSSADEDEDEDCTEETAAKFPSWALSMSGSSPFLWSLKPARASSSSHLAFEKQFGWDKLLDAKIGLQWSFSSASDTSVPSLAACSSVVRVWDDLPRKLVRKIGLDERRILSLDTRFQEGLACTGSMSGKMSMWDLERRAYVSETVALRHPVLAVSMDSDVFATVLASATGFGLWDHRSASASLNVTSMPAGIVSDVRSRGNGLCVATRNDNLSMYDLRKPSCGPVGTDRATHRQGNVSLPKYDHAFWLKFTCSDEDEDADSDGAECHFAMEDGASKSPAYASWLSKLTTYVRSVTLTPH